MFSCSSQECDPVISVLMMLDLHHPASQTEQGTTLVLTMI